MELMYFLLFFPLGTTKNPGHYLSNKQKMTGWWREEGRQAKDLEIQGMTEVNYLKFSFFLFLFLPHISHTWSWRSWQPEIPMGAHQKNPKQKILNKNLALFSQKTKKGAPYQDRELIHNNYLTPAKHTKNKTKQNLWPPTLTLSMPIWETYDAVRRCSYPPGLQGRQVGSQNFNSIQ